MRRAHVVSYKYAVKGEEVTYKRVSLEGRAKGLMRGRKALFRDYLETVYGRATSGVDVRRQLAKFRNRMLVESRYAFQVARATWNRINDVLEPKALGKEIMKEKNRLLAKLRTIIKKGL